MGRREPTETMVVPQGRFELSRWPDRQGSPLRAWDAADEYLLDHLHQEAVPLDGTVLIVNDAFGALGTALGPDADISWGDSVVSHRALAANLGRTNRAGAVALPGSETPGSTVDVVLMKVPKHNSLLEDQLHRLRPLLLPSSRVIVAGMTKNIHTSTLGLLEEILGPTRTSLAKKKARLAFTTFDPDLRPGPNPWPVTWKYDGLIIVNHGGVFSARSIDVGTRFLLHHLPGDLADGARVVDLGCGNGVVGAAVLAANPGVSCLFVDESYAAIASARSTVRQSAPEGIATFAVVASLDEVAEPGSIDLIINNPPFHASTSLSNATAEEMFRSGHRALRSGGDLLVIGNRHLGHHVRIKRIFGNSTTIAGNPKFVIMHATRQ